MRKLALLLAAPLALASATASAHFSLTSPPSPTASPDGKGSPPCGPDTGDGIVTTVLGGSQLKLEVNENVRHGGFYRAALALKSCKTKGCFPDDNKVYDKASKLLAPTGPGESDHADSMATPVFPILGDNLFFHEQNPKVGEPPPPKYSGMITIPNIACEKCTLQVIEFMAPHGPNGDAGYFYHHCADLKITLDANKPADPVGTGGGGGGGAGGAGGAAGGGAGGTAGASGAATGGGGAGGATTGGGGAGGTTGGSTPGTSGTGGTTGNVGAAGTAGAPGTAGALGTAGAPGTAGTGTTTGATSNDDSGCGIAKRSQGGASVLAALGLLFALGRRRRSR